MRRTQLYIEEGLFHWLSLLSRERKTTISDLVRRALEKVYGKRRSVKARLKALQAACGTWKDRTDLPPTDQYIRELRKGTRMKRFGLE
ncbi:MAG: CopG family transcriptional regulator [Deltaproteobacteria bacterium]|nr:CopG family transcriptional regulator [Deltaproteobacteria bacterium]